MSTQWQLPKQPHAAHKLTHKGRMCQTQALNLMNLMLWCCCHCALLLAAIACCCLLLPAAAAAAYCCCLLLLPAAAAACCCCCCFCCCRGALQNALGLLWPADGSDVAGDDLQAGSAAEFARIVPAMGSLFDMLAGMLGDSGAPGGREGALARVRGHLAEVKGKVADKTRWVTGRSVSDILHWWSKAPGCPRCSQTPICMTVVWAGCIPFGALLLALPAIDGWVLVVLGCRCNPWHVCSSCSCSVSLLEGKLCMCLTLQHHT
jgi:hypothetical protein